MDSVAIAAHALAWSIINRFRGWGGINAPAWLMWIQKRVFNRPILSAMQAIMTAGYQYSQGVGLAAAGVICAVLFGGWLVAVSPGWGLYFAAWTGQWKQGETEIQWIDRIGFVMAPWVSEIDERSNRRRGRICFALRGAYYLPMFIGVAATNWYFIGWSWWLILSVACFWTDGVVYGIRWVEQGDNTRWCELIGGGVRGALVGAALILAQ